MLTQQDIERFLEIGKEYRTIYSQAHDKALEIAKLIERDTDFIEDFSIGLNEVYFECMSGSIRDNYAVNDYNIPTWWLYETTERLRGHLIPSFLRERERLARIAELERTKRQAEEELKRQEQLAKWKEEAEHAKYLELKAKYEEDL